ncbi:MAG: hypothetical protein ACREB6_17060, partial [Rhodospirillales bacterium]
GLWERLFMELARVGGPPAEALLDSTHVKVHRSASGGRRRKKTLVPAKLLAPSAQAEVGAIPRSI